MKRKNSIYKSASGRKEVLKLYDRQLKRLPIPYRDLYVSTSFGKTHLIETGSPEGEPLLGCFSKESKEVVRTLEAQVQALCEEVEDTLVIVTADHGHDNSRGVAIIDYPEVMECLVRMPSIEPRALNLFVKPDKKEQFEKEFNRLFGEKFMLMTKQEVIESQIFGTGKEHACFRDMLGDYLAIAVGDLAIYNTKEEAEHFIGIHAGLTKEEMTIPLIVTVCQ